MTPKSAKAVDVSAKAGYNFHHANAVTQTELANLVKGVCFFMAQFPFTQAEYQRLHDALFQAYIEGQGNAAVYAKQGSDYLAEKSYKLSEECLALADLVSLKMSAERQAETCALYTAEEWYNIYKEYYDERQAKKQERTA